jgi:hypothetical protein
MDTVTLERVALQLQQDAESMIKNLKHTNDPYETGWIKGYNEALMKHAFLIMEEVREYQRADALQNQAENALNSGE